MELIQNQINSCFICGNYQKLTKNSIKLGTTKFIIIGESPTKSWINSGKAFYNINGKLDPTIKVLEKLLNEININLNDIYFTECAKCFVENKKDLAKFGNNCKVFLTKQLNNINCNIILSMGLKTTEILLNKKIAKFEDFAGKVFNVKFGEKDFILIPIYHTSPANPKGYKNNIIIFSKIKSLII